MKIVFRIFLFFFGIGILNACTEEIKPPPDDLLTDVLNFSGIPETPGDRSALVFSDQGAWFGFGFQDTINYKAGFSGPFLMTQQNGVWLGPLGCYLDLGCNYDDLEQYSALSHLEQSYINDTLYLYQSLFFSNAQSAITVTEIYNYSDQSITINPEIRGELFKGINTIHMSGDTLVFTSEKSTAIGYLTFSGLQFAGQLLTDSSFIITTHKLHIHADSSIKLAWHHSYIFPEYAESVEAIVWSTDESEDILSRRIAEKQDCKARLYTAEIKPEYDVLLEKCLMTLQNNWRSPAGELKHAGLFPSYHYKWFHGYWAWDSWKHAVALALYNPELAKDQIRAMYDFMDDDGFIADCVYRDTTIEMHNYRNTKPPLSAWALWKIYEADRDASFLQEMLPLLETQHKWWYSHRDHDQDGLCEYGSTDGSVIAAKWESGMDNAVRFDNSWILKNHAGAYSLNQESVDLNAYLFAEKKYLRQICDALDMNEEARLYKKEAKELKNKIQNQFYDKETGWFYDTNLPGTSFIKDMGCEGWIALWAEVATKEQAYAVTQNMLDTTLFNTYMPLPTLNASHPKFTPDGGYWRGPNWIDQCYFGIVGLENYGFENSANQIKQKLMHHAEGLMDRGPSIRENYHPLTGKGLESHNFSWSAAHYLLLLAE